MNLKYLSIKLNQEKNEKQCAGAYYWKTTGSKNF